MQTLEVDVAALQLLPETHPVGLSEIGLKGYRRINIINKINVQVNVNICGAVSCVISNFAQF